MNTPCIHQQPQTEWNESTSTGARQGSLHWVVLLTLMGLVLQMCEAADTIPTLSDEHWCVQVNAHRALTGSLAQAFMKRPEYVQVQAGIAFFSVLTGIDPMRDPVLVTMRGIDGSDSSALIYVQAHMDRTRLLSLASSAKGYSSDTYAKREIVHWLDTRNGVDKDAYGALVTDDLLIIAADITRLHRALDRFDGKPNAVDATPSELPVQPVLGADTVLQGSCVGMQQWKAIAGQPELIRQVHQITVSVGDSADAVSVTATLGCMDVATATQIHDLIQGLVALSRLSQSGPAGGIVALVTSSLHMTLDGSTITTQAQVPVSAITTAIAPSPHSSAVSPAPAPTR